ncbi:MAG: MFS transporter, partial [Candidatus Izemoplasmatales bacterium]|nr:MFS transporter [Candidatus Izemoplasmatales bacterium]
SVFVGRKVTAKNKRQFFLPSLAILVVGLIGLFVTRSAVLVGIAGFVMMSANLVFTAVLNAKVRDHTPLDKVGHFQGIRMIFYVLIPMVIGPFLGAAVIENGGATYFDLGVLKPVPTPGIFLASALVCLFILIPLWFAWKSEDKASLQ